MAKTQDNAATGTQKMKGVRIRVLNVVMICLAALVALVFLQAVKQTNDAYGELEDATNRYIASASACNSMKEASNYLTIQVRTFAATQNPVYMERYFEEAVETQRREKAIATIRDNLLPNSRASEYLDKSLEYSIDLMNREYYSMKLVVEAKGIEVGRNEQVLNEVVLSDKDAALSPEEKIELATSMLYDEVYADEVSNIEGNVVQCRRELVSSLEHIQDENSALLHKLLNRQEVFTWMMFAVVIGLILSFIVMLLWPIQHYIVRIRANEPLPLAGAYELRYLAQAYNTMYDENLRSRSQLQKEADHDHLTGLYNRAVFEKLLYAYREQPIALLLVDADYFKNVNDTLGHDGGDAMLQKLGKQLQQTFRQSDYACRIGGDEFAVIMTDIGPELKSVVEMRINAVAAGMRDTSDGLPEMTLSIGVAFSGTGMEGDKLFKCADNALYAVKEAGRNGHGFYEGE